MLASLLGATPSPPARALLARHAQLAHAAGALVCVDNSILTCLYQSPLELGADISMTSGGWRGWVGGWVAGGRVLGLLPCCRCCRRCRILLHLPVPRLAPLCPPVRPAPATKFIGGHSDVTAGVLAVNDKQLAERLYFLQVTGGSWRAAPAPGAVLARAPGSHSAAAAHAPWGACWRPVHPPEPLPPPQNAEGTALGPQDCWLLVRGLKTMALRMERQVANARRIAAWLAQHPLVQRVNYPGLEGHPGKDVHDRQVCVRVCVC